MLHRLLIATLAALLPALAAAAPVADLRLPPGFRIAVWADDVPDARVLRLGRDGTVFVSTRSGGRLYALRDADGDGRAERRWVLADGLAMPNGIALKDGDLYVADLGRILRLRDIERHLDAPPPPELLRDDLPGERHHGWRFADFGPDGRLYVAVGAPCNICDRPGYAEIRALDPGGGAMETVARGVRNTVGFTWRPGTRELWFTDNGRDWLGDDAPPDELNILAAPGAHFGYPYCHGGRIPDPEFGAGRRCADYTAPAVALDAHVAPLGIVFYAGSQFPAEYRGRVFVAEHGSWNRSSKIGYRVMMADVRDGRPYDYRPFAQGWLGADGKVWGRPAYLLELPDGSLLLSDDQGGRIYRISYRP